MKRKRALAAFVALALVGPISACTDGPASPEAELSGSWGGDGFGLQVSTGTASAIFDCAYGTLETPIPLAHDGSFSVEGEYVREVGPAALANPASYTGRVMGSEIELSVIVRDTLASGGDYVVGPFAGGRGDDPSVVYCQ